MYRKPRGNWFTEMSSEEIGIDVSYAHQVEQNGREGLDLMASGAKH